MRACHHGDARDAALILAEIGDIEIGIVRSADIEALRQRAAVDRQCGAAHRISIDLGGRAGNRRSRCALHIVDDDRDADAGRRQADAQRAGDHLHGVGIIGDDADIIRSRHIGAAVDPGGDVGVGDVGDHRAGNADVLRHRDADGNRQDVGVRRGIEQDIVVHGHLGAADRRGDRIADLVVGDRGGRPPRCRGRCRAVPAAPRISALSVARTTRLAPSTTVLDGVALLPPTAAETVLLMRLMLLDASPANLPSDTAMPTATPRISALLSAVTTTSPLSETTRA